MKCNEADLFIMKYMDGNISEDEAHMLNEHFLKCNSCKDEFVIYDSMLTEFTMMTDFEAPAGFEASVMAQIKCINEDEFEISFNSVGTDSNNVWRNIWGTFTVLFGTGTMLVLYREPIMTSLAQNPYVGEQIQKLMPVAENISQNGETLGKLTENVFIMADNVLANSMGIILGILTFICGIQIYLLYRKRNFDKVDD